MFFPAYNDSGTIASLVITALQSASRLTPNYEIIVVNDGSRDDSAEVLKGLQGRVARLKVVTHDRNRGYGAALRSGFATATKDLVFYTDGDGQYDVRELPILLMLLTDDTHFVNGIKMTRQDPMYRVHIGSIHRFLMRWSFWLPVNDVDCDFRLVRRSVIERIALRSNSGSICVELVKNAQRAGAEFREVSVHHYPRKWGASEFFKPGRIIHTYIDLAGSWLQLMVIDKLRGKRSVRIAP